MIMKLKTDQPIILNRENITRKIAKFWDQISEGWRTVWGPHIHHGYYETDQPISPQDAQEKLIEKLTEMMVIVPNEKILDVGCGMGASSIYLAKKYQAEVSGITLSQKQVDIATQQAQISNTRNVNFKIEDALSLASFADNSFDVVWSLESCEQFFDKELFIKQAYRVLKPGGKFILVTWCSSDAEYEGRLAKKYRKLCLAFDVPYMPTMEHYTELLKKNNFILTTSADWTTYVKRSWDIGVSLVNLYSFFYILKISGWRGLLFSKQIKLMQEAFLNQRLKYGVFLMTK